MECPNFKLERPDNAKSCDCGYEFGGSDRRSLTATKEPAGAKHLLSILVGGNVACVLFLAFYYFLDRNITTGGSPSAQPVNQYVPPPPGANDELSFAQAPQKSKQKQAGSSDSKKAAEFLDARIAFAGLLDATFRKQGYLMLVEANGSDKRTLEVSSVLLFEGSRTMNAALQILEDAAIFANIKNCRFNKVVFTGDDFSIEYSLTSGRARRVK